MADDDFGDKTEAPTPRRRAEAREQGNIARSPDLAAAVLLLAVIILLNWYGPNLMGALKTFMADMLGSDSIRDLSTADTSTQLLFALRIVAVALAPIFAGIVLIAVLVNMAQVGFFFSTKRITPDLAALNPTKGLSRLFNGRDNLVHLGMSLLKMFLVGIFAYSAVHGKLPLILSTQQLDFVQIFSLGASLVYAIGIRIGAILLVLAIIDYAYQRWRNEQQLKMSKQEIKEEMKRMEGDPKIKNRRRQIAMQRLMQAIKKNVPSADVIVTNPTEYAVALKYDAGTMHAPKVVAKGADHMAMRIRQIAIESGIPILERPPLARALYRLVDIGQEIPEQFYSAVAEILAYVYELSGKLKRKREEFAAT
jgi:flagellar biosynthetic protein FlhB